MADNYVCAAYAVIQTRHNSIPPMCGALVQCVAFLASDLEGRTSLGSGPSLPQYSIRCVIALTKIFE